MDGELGRALEVSSARVGAKPRWVVGAGRRLILLQGGPSSPPDFPP